MIKQIFLDLETTGIDPSKHGIYQIGGIIRRSGKIIDQAQFNCDIFAEDEISETAFENTSIKPDDLLNYPDPVTVHNQFIDLLDQHIDKYNKKDKFFFINFGAEFDHKFLRKWFESCGNDYFGSYFWHPPIEVQTLAAEFLKNKRTEMPNFKLATVAKTLGITVDEEKTHTALYDANLAMQVYDICTVEKIDFIKRANKNTEEISEIGKYNLDKTKTFRRRRVE